MSSSLALKRCNLFNNLLAEQVASEHMGAVDCWPLEVDLDTSFKVPKEALTEQASSAIRAKAHDLLCEVCQHLKLSLGARWSTSCARLHFSSPFCKMSLVFAGVMSVFRRTLLKSNRRSVLSI